jgi:ribosomal protein S18 acetylase RimI-like enzyme
MTVSEAEFGDYSDAIERLFQEYHEWNKQGVVESLGGVAAPVEEVEQSYDIEGFIDEDISKLTDFTTDTRLFIAQQNDEIVGCVFLEARTKQDAEVKRLYVQPKARGEGLGRALMEAVINTAKEDDYSNLLLFTAPVTEAAQSLYKDLGFELTDPFECEAPEQAYDDVIFMHLDVD